MDVWIVRMGSTGENWHTYVCLNLEAVNRSLLKSYGMIRYQGNDSSDYMEYHNPSDLTQTATVMKQFAVR